MHNAGFFLKYKLHHLVLWMLVAGIWYFLRYQDYPTQQIAIEVTLVKVIDLALMIYLTNYLLLPKLFYKKHYALFALAFIAMILVSSIGKMTIIGQVLDISGNWKPRIYDNVIPHIFLVIAGGTLKIMYDYTKMQQSLAELAKEKSEAELNFLKSQVNPHFLFNSLNAVYFLINKENAEARNALHKFSDMLRYQLYEMKGEMIAVEKEIGYLQDYVALQQLRKDEKYDVRFYCTPDVKGFSIAPLLLIPFVENAFKHISHSSEKKNFVKVDLSRLNGTLFFSVENSKDNNQKITEEHGGIGLINVKRRLDLIYPGKHHLDITEKNELYKIELKIEV